MKINWQTKRLGEVCDILDSKRKPITKRNRISGKYPYYGATGILDYVADYIFDEKLVLIGEDGAKWESGENTAFIADSKYWVNNHAHVLRPHRDIILNNWIVFFFYFNDITKYTTGLTVSKLNQTNLKQIEIPLPPLAEQKRIVGMLDGVFGDVGKVKESAGKNLANAKELFESYLQSVSGDKKALGFVVDIKTGKLNANAMVDGGQYPFFTCAKEIYAINEYAFDCEAILLAGNNAVGDFNVKHYKGKFNAYQRTYVITADKENKILYRYLYFQLLKSLKEFKGKSVGTGTKFLKLGMIQDLQIVLPSLSEQKQIVKKLDELSAETKRLEAIYQRKIDDLEELKKSVLKKAFSGNL